MLQTTGTAIAAELRAFVVDRFLFGDSRTPLRDDESLLARGIVDSTGILELVAFIEEKYGIRVADEELVPENLESISNAAAFVSRKLG
jgi:acyl carrier protein